MKPPGNERRGARSGRDNVDGEKIQSGSDPGHTGHPGHPGGPDDPDDPDDHGDPSDPGDPGAPAAVHVCEICGAEMFESHCKIICPRCGYRRDCSDP